MLRVTTNLIIEHVDDELFTAEEVLQSLLMYLSDRQVTHFYKDVIEPMREQANG